MKLSRLSRLSHCFYSLLMGGFFMFAAGSPRAEVVVLGEVDFESGTIPASNGWGFGSQQGGQVSISTDTSLNFNGSKGSIRGVYPKPGAGNVYVWGGLDIASLNLRDIYIEFHAKMPNAKYGVKFLKVFGQRTTDTPGEHYANMTFLLDYTGVDYGGMWGFGFGDGTTEGNDAQNVVKFTGEDPTWVGRSRAVAIVNTPQKKIWPSSAWGSEWHHFRFHVKFNSGTTKETEVPDGAVYVEIDGKVYADVKNIFNRHYTNKPIQNISFFDWSQGGTVPFELWYDDIKITTGGFSQNNNPAPPSRPTLILN